MITLKEEIQPFPKILYHSVSTSSYDYILKNGIKPDSDGFIYLSKYPIKNKNYNHTFQVKIPDMNKLHDWREFWQDEDGNEIDFDHEYDNENPYFVYIGEIPKEHLKEI